VVGRVDRGELLTELPSLHPGLLPLLLGIVQDNVFYTLVQVNVGISARLLLEIRQCKNLRLNVRGLCLHRILIVYGGIGRVRNRLVIVWQHLLHLGHLGVQTTHNTLLISIVEGRGVLLPALEGRAARGHFTNVTVYRLQVVC